eukprot:31510_6
MEMEAPRVARLRLILELLVIIQPLAISCREADIFSVELPTNTYRYSRPCNHPRANQEMRYRRACLSQASLARVSRVRLNARDEGDKYFVP